MSQDFFRGIKAAIPPCLGVIPIAVSIGLLGMQQAHLSAWETIFMSAKYWIIRQENLSAQLLQKIKQ